MGLALFDQEQAKQKRRTDKGTQGVKNKRGHQVGGLRLRDKRQAPKQGGKAQNGTALDVIEAFHGSSRPFFKDAPIITQVSQKVNRFANIVNFYVKFLHLKSNGAIIGCIFVKGGERFVTADAKSHC